MNARRDIAAYLRQLKIESRASGHTLVAYERDLRDFAARLGDLNVARWDELTEQHIKTCVAQRHRGGLSPRSLHRYLSSVRGLLNYLEREGRLDVNVAAHVKAPKTRAKLPATLDADEVAQLLDLPATQPIEIRDKAMLELFYSSGLRLSELTGLDWADLDLTAGTVRLLGKGRKTRQVPVGRQAREALSEWQQVRAGWASGEAGAVFIARSGKRLSNRAVQQRIRHWAERQGLWKKVHPHLLRHCFASHLLESSGELRAVQELLGHADISTTQVYTHLDFQHLAQVYDKAHPRARRK